MTYESIIDASVGILKDIHLIPPIAGEPEALVGYSAFVGNLGWLLRWMPDLVGTGFSFADESARHAAVGEAIERYCGNCPEQEIIVASIDDLNGNGISYYNPLDSPMFTPSQYEHPRFPFHPLTRSDLIEWVQGERLVPTRQVTLLPAALVYLNYYRFMKPGKGRRNFPVLLSGIAAGPDENAAKLSALFEILERDATMLWWHGGLAAKELDISGSWRLDRKLREGTSNATRLRLLMLPTDHPVFVVASVLINEKEDILVAGFAARAQIESAVLKATAEAFQLRRVALAIRDPESWLWKGGKAGLLRYPVRPFRADQTYRDAFADDWSDMTQLPHNSQYYLDRRTWQPTLERLQPMETTKLEEVQEPDFAYFDTTGVWTALGDHLSAAAMSVYTCDVTTTDVAPCGLKVMRVLVPEAMGNNPTAIPMLGNARFQALCTDSESEPFLLPLPHS
jgi:ribosomal protein S12 methylthiotransferase accessory factor